MSKASYAASSIIQSYAVHQFGAEMDTNDVVDVKRAKCQAAAKSTFGPSKVLVNV